MQKPMNFDETKVMNERVQAEVGGHYMRVLRVDERKNKKGGDMIVVCYDFADNDKQPRLYQNEFNGNTDPNKQWPIGGREYINVYDYEGKCSRNFKGFCTSVEKSNPGFSIDWNLTDWGSQFRGKYIGGVYGNVEDEYNGKVYMRPRLRWFVANSDVENAKIPQDKLLPAGGYNSYSTTQTPSYNTDDLPF